MDWFKGSWVHISGAFGLVVFQGHLGVTQFIVSKYPVYKLKMAVRTTKQIEIWDSKVLLEHACGTSKLVALKVIFL